MRASQRSANAGRDFASSDSTGSTAWRLSPFESFRFHMTLTGRVPDHDLPHVRAAIDEAARKAAVFIERAQAEERVRQRDRRFESVLSASGVPFVMLSPLRDSAGKITDFRWLFLNAAAANVMRCKPADFVGPPALRSTCTWRYFIPTSRQPIRLLRICEPRSNSPDGAGARDVAFAFDL